MKKKRLNLGNRILIEELLKLNYKLKDIANIIEIDMGIGKFEDKKRFFGKI